MAVCAHHTVLALLFSAAKQHFSLMAVESLPPSLLAEALSCKFQTCQLDGFQK